MVWKIKHLDEVSIIKMGQSPPSSAYNETKDGLYLIQGNADLKNGYTRPRFYTSIVTKACEVGDIIFTVRAPVGDIAISNHKACIGRGVASIKSIDINDKFLYYSLLSFDSIWNKLQQGSTFSAINSSDLKKLKIPYPPLPEQKKIASILSTVDEAIQNVKAQIERTKELKKGLMQQLFSEGIGHTEFKESKLGRIPREWEVVKIGDLGVFKKGKGISKKELTEVGVPCIRYGELYTKHHEVIREYHSYIPEEITSDLVALQKGDLLFAGSGETLEDIGKSAAFTNDTTVYAGGDIVILSPLEKLNSSFAGYLFNSPIVRNQLSRLGQGGTVMHIYASNISQAIIALPKINEQKEIAKLFGILDEKLIRYAIEKLNLEELKKGLMQKLLTGEVRVKVNE